MSALTISPEDEKRVKGMGFLNNRGTDLFSARVLTTNGKVTAAQHRCMADAAEKFGNGELLYTEVLLLPASVLLREDLSCADERSRHQ